MRFDRERKVFVVDEAMELPAKFFIDEEYEYPSGLFGEPRMLCQKTRVVRCYFENRWAVSIIWGSMTYSINHDHPWGFRDCTTGERSVSEFVEEPPTVEVGIIMPEEKVIPEKDYSDIPDWHGPKTFPEYTVELWTDPIGWCDAETVRLIVEEVRRFDSHDYPRGEIDLRVEHIDGRPRLTYTVDAGDKL